MLTVLAFAVAAALIETSHSVLRQIGRFRFMTTSVPNGTDMRDKQFAFKPRISSLGLGVLLAFAILPFTLQTGVAQAISDRRPPRPVGIVSVDAPLQQMLDGYLRWLEHHPEAVPRPDHPLIPPVSQMGSAPSSEPAVNPFVIKIPSLNLYSPAGRLIYQFNSYKENIEFLQTFPSSFRKVRLEKTSKVAPTLREVVEMLPELKAYESVILGSTGYTMIAITCPDTAHCKEQNQAIQQLHGRVRQSGVTIVELVLHR